MIIKKLLYKEDYSSIGSISDIPKLTIENIIDILKEKGLLGDINSMPISIKHEVKNFPLNFRGIMKETRKDFTLSFKYRSPVMDEKNQIKKFKISKNIHGMDIVAFFSKSKDKFEFKIYRVSKFQSSFNDITASFYKKIESDLAGLEEEQIYSYYLELRNSNQYSNFHVAIKSHIIRELLANLYHIEVKSSADWIDQARSRFSEELYSLELDDIIKAQLSDINEYENYASKIKVEKRTAPQTKSVIYKRGIKIAKGESLPELTPQLIGELLIESPQGFRNYADYEITKFDVNFRISINESRKDITFHYIDSQPIYSTESLTPEGFPTEITGYNHRIILIDTISFYTKIKEGMTELRIYQIGARYMPEKLTINDAHGLADSYCKTDNFDEAIRIYNEILEQIPNDIDALTNIGLALVSINEYRQAINNYKKALEIEPNDALIWVNLGIAYEYNNDIENAKKSYIKAYELDPEFNEIKEHLEQLEKS